LLRCVATFFPFEESVVEDFLPSFDFVRERRSIFFPEAPLLLPLWLLEPFLVVFFFDVSSEEEAERVRDLLGGRLRIFIAGRGEEDELFFEFVGLPGEDGAGGGFF
jgi:hypothetical protein